MEYTIFHWGLHPWALYGVVGHGAGLRDLPQGPAQPAQLHRVPEEADHATLPAAPSTSSGCSSRPSVRRPPSASGAIQINSGLTRVFDAPTSNTVAIVVIVALTAAFVVSAVSGTERGIKWLANTNAALAVGLLVFVFVFGPTIFLLNTFTETIGGYLEQFVPMSFRTGAFGGGDWLAGWTIFYWAWWMSWAPFVGTFMARISRGRTIREFVVCVLIVPTLVSTIWFVVMGGTAIASSSTASTDMAGSLDSGVENTLFTMLDAMPLSTFTAFVVVVLIMLFYVAGADSASLVLGMLSQGGSLHPKTWLVVIVGLDDRRRGDRPAAGRRAVGDPDHRHRLRRPVPRRDGLGLLQPRQAAARRARDDHRSSGGSHHAGRTAWGFHDVHQWRRPALGAPGDCSRPAVGPAQSVTGSTSHAKTMQTFPAAPRSATR